MSRAQFFRYSFELLSASRMQGTPLGRLGQPDDVLGAVLFLGSPAVYWMTGSLAVVEGSAMSALQ